MCSVRGRAGRRLDSAALIVTYAQRRSHDLTSFTDPAQIIAGAVRPPVVPIENPRIAQRHLFSIAFSLFFRHEFLTRQERYSTVASFFGRDEAGAHPFERLAPWLFAAPAALVDAVREVLPEVLVSAPELAWDTWTKELARLLSEVATLHIDEMTLYDDAAKSAYEKKNGRYGDLLERTRKTLEKRDLLGFLANRNLLPKYGFPVDTVELKTAGSGTTLGADLELSRDLSQAIFEYAPGSKLVAGGYVWESAGLVRRNGKEDQQKFFRICAECDRYSESLEPDPAACVDCGEPPTGTPRKYVEPRSGFIGVGGVERPGDSPPRVSWRGEVRIAEDGQVIAKEEIAFPRGALCVYTMERAYMVRINSGLSDRGFRICSFCGRGIDASNEWPAAHTSIIGDRPCGGHPWSLSLAHKYQTDVVRIVFPISWESPESNLSTAMSVLYSVLNGAANALQISPSNIDGTVTQLNSSLATLNIVDTVPGGAGYAKLIASSIEIVLKSTLDLVTNCECGEETSCYMCLRSYANQRFHDVLSRGSAQAFLERVLLAEERGEPKASKASGPRTTADEWDDALLLGADHAAKLMLTLRSAGIASPSVGVDLGPDMQWIVELVWEKEKLCIVADLDSERDEWLMKEGWTLMTALPGDDHSEVASAVIQRLASV